MRLTDPIQVLPRIGEQRMKRFHALDIYTIQDLIEFFPRDYVDRSLVLPLADALGDDWTGREVTIRVRLLNGTLQYGKGRSYVRFQAVEETGKHSLTVIWYNQPYLKKQLEQDKEQVYRLTGKVVWTNGKPFMKAPFLEKEGVASLATGRIVPVYHGTAGMTQNILRGAVAEALKGVKNQLDEFLPADVMQTHQLCSRLSAVENIHFPKDDAGFLAARKRLVFEELLLLQVALFRIKGYMKKETDIRVAPMDLSPVYDCLPYQLTGAQARVLQDILSDMESGYVMNRLVQGDVGSGKTAVAMLAAFACVQSGYQVAVMAPTDVLARQHYASFQDLLGNFSLTCVLLSGKMKAAEKREALDRIRTGQADVVIGTHALIQEGVYFSRLGLVITDEQHRFGVRQRRALSQKGEEPHVLIMTATPIPRTLGLILYGDMDISALDEMPPGRQPVETYGVNTAYRPRIIEFIRKEIMEGRQAYVICPTIEEKEEKAGEKENQLRLQSVEQYTEYLQRMLPDLRIGSLHGKMNAQCKNELMENFSSGMVQVLVSTTVVEVGVNVPNATVMVIENAERFGLSQLHQLRGRVGRGGGKSFCILVTDSKGKVCKQRIKLMTQTNDGFQIAEMDLKLRGHGDFFGTAQHGLPALKIANLYEDLHILKQVQEVARLYLEGQYKNCQALDREVQSLVSTFEHHGL